MDTQPQNLCHRCGANELYTSALDDFVRCRACGAEFNVNDEPLPESHDVAFYRDVANAQRERAEKAEKEREQLLQFVKEVAGLSLLIADDREFALIQRARTLVRPTGVLGP